MLLFLNKIADRKHKQATAQKVLTPYFAFGSNMDLEQLESRVGSVHQWKVSRLTGYRLVFNKYSTTRMCGAGNLIQTDNPDDIVEGVVFYLNNHQLNMLDKFEGYRTPLGTLSKNPTGYKQVSVTLDGGSTAVTYIANVDAGIGQFNHLKQTKGIILTRDMLKPSIDYLDHFLKGGALGLSEEYLNLLENTEVIEGGTYQENHSSKGKKKVTAAI